MDLQSILNDPDFKGATPDLQRKILEKHAPDYAKTLPPLDSQRGIGDTLLTAAAAPFRAASKIADFGTGNLVDAARWAQGESPRSILTNPAPGSPTANPLVTQPLRMAGSAAPGLPLKMGFSAAGEMLAQKTERPDQPVDPAQTLIATGLPAAGEFAGLFGRGLARTADRFIPSRFYGRQAAAQQGAADTADAIASTESAKQLLGAAKKTGDVLDAKAITKVMDEVELSLPKNAANSSLQTANTHIENLRDAIQGGKISLNDLLAQRRDLSLSVAKGNKEATALYGGILSTLEDAAAAGGPGAAMARAGLDAYKKDLGASKFAMLVEKAISDVSGGANLNITKLRGLVRKDRKDLEKLLGPDGMGRVDQFLLEHRTLPPAHALNYATVMKMLLGGSGVGWMGGPMGAVAGTVGPELAQNMWMSWPNSPLYGKLVAPNLQGAREYLR